MRYRDCPECFVTLARRGTAKKSGKEVYHHWPFIFEASNELKIGTVLQHYLYPKHTLKVISTRPENTLTFHMAWYVNGEVVEEPLAWFPGELTEDWWIKQI